MIVFRPLGFAFIILSMGFAALAAEPKYQEDLEEIIKALPGDYSEIDVRNLVFERKSESASSSMKVLGLHRAIKTKQAYELTSRGLIPTEKTSESIELPPSSVELTSKVIPAHLDLQGKWLDQRSGEGRSANILGENGLFKAKTTTAEVTIPIASTDSNSLAYYGALLLEQSQTIVFPDEEIGYPIWAMSLGTTYVQDYLMSETGGGWYLEWHTDRPHFHMPLSEDASGIYLLAKRVATDTLRVSAFRIPYGKAIFTKRGTIHCDAGLTGERWIVGFTTSKNYSTVLLRSQENEFLKLRFKR